MRSWISSVATTLLVTASFGCAPPSPVLPSAPQAASPAAALVPAAPSVRAGVELPGVDLVTLDHGRARLDATLRGKVGLVSLWATWCESCAREFDALNRLDARARDRGAVVVGVAVGEPAGTVADFVRRHDLRYAQLVDEGFYLADALGQRKVPATVVVDRAGRVVFVGGALDERALAAFRAALDGG